MNNLSQSLKIRLTVAFLRYKSVSKEDRAENKKSLTKANRMNFEIKTARSSILAVKTISEQTQLTVYDKNR